MRAALIRPGSRGRRAAGRAPPNRGSTNSAERPEPNDRARAGDALAPEQARQLETQAQEQQLAALAEQYPYTAEVVAGHVANVGHDFAQTFEDGLDLILDALAQRRNLA